MDAETGWYNFGKRYLDPKVGLWLSADPALGEYLPNAPLTDDDKKHNQNLPGNGGIYNAVNFALYHFAGNNPIRYTDPDGAADGIAVPEVPGWVSELGLGVLAYAGVDVATGGGLTSGLEQLNNTMGNAQHHVEDYIASLFATKTNAKPLATSQAQTKTKENGGNQVIIQIQGKAISSNWRSSAGGGTVMGTIRSDKPITAAEVQAKIRELMTGLTFDEKGAVAKPVVDMSQFLERTAADGGVYGSGAYRTESTNKDNRVDLIWSGEMNLTLGEQ